jgi:hypothetical protein
MWKWTSGWYAPTAQGRRVERVLAFRKQDIAGRLIADLVPQIGQRPCNPVIAPVTVLLGHTNNQLLNLSLIRGLPGLRSAFEPSNLRAACGTRPGWSRAGPHWPPRREPCGPIDDRSRRLLRDRDKSYGPAFRHRIRAMGVTEVITAPRSPWQNPYVERLIGSIRRECSITLSSSTSVICAEPREVGEAARSVCPTQLPLILFLSKDSTRPADIPVERAAKFEFAVNLKTAKALDVAVPTSIPLRADEVIE